VFAHIPGRKDTQFPSSAAVYGDIKQGLCLLIIVKFIAEFL
jgi:hypothetical protein